MVTRKKSRRTNIQGDSKTQVLALNSIANQLKTNSALLQRLSLASQAGIRFDGQRDLYNVFGYVKGLTPDHYVAKYYRQDIASRIVDAPPDAIWSNPPVIKAAKGTQTTWSKLVEDKNLWVNIRRADILNRLGPYSLLLVGFSDGQPLERPLIAGKNEVQVLYMRPIASKRVDKIELDKDPKSERFGKPLMYHISLDQVDTVSAGITSTTGITNTLRVHHSRVIHIVEHPTESDIVGTPIMERVFNLLDDLLKVSGGTSETYWLTATRGMQADIDKEMDFDPEDAEALTDEIEEFQHQLRRFIKTRGVKLNVLQSDTPQPKDTFEMIMALISGTTGIPRRILLGSEAGQLASEQDRANWSERIMERRALFAEPIILRPLTQMLQNAGVIAKTPVEFVWPEAFILNPLEASMQMAQTARAVGNLSRQTGNKAPMQLTSREEARDIIGLEGDLPESEILETEPDLALTPGFEGDSEDVQTEGRSGQGATTNGE